MKKTVLTAAIAGTALLASCGADTNMDAVKAEVEKTTQLDTMEAKANYLIGYNNISQLKAQGVDLDLQAFLKGASDAGNDTESLFSQEEQAQIMGDFSAQVQAKAKAEAEAASLENSTTSAAFLAENKAKDGVITTESGLQYKVITMGEGDKPTAESTVQVNYEGKLINGTVFDSSFERGKAIEFPLSGVIKGWTEGLQLMPEGSRFEFYIPSELAYGERGPASIGPNQALIFKVDLIQANFKAPE